MGVHHAGRTLLLGGEWWSSREPRTLDQLRRIADSLYAIRARRLPVGGRRYSDPVIGNAVKIVSALGVLR